MKKYWPWLLAGLILRLVLMPTTVHPDIRGHYLGGYFITRYGQYLGVYDFISRLPRNHPYVTTYGDDFLVYSPLTYWFHAAILKFWSPIFPYSLFDTLEIQMDHALVTPGIGWLLFMLKFPYLLVDIICLILVWKIVSPPQQKLALILWTFNLPLIYSAFMMGQFDILTVVFILAALLAVKHKRPVLASLLLGIGSGFKPFPLLLLPVVPGNRFKNIAIGFLTYLLIIAPYLGSPAFRLYALQAPHTEKMWYARIMVSGSQYLSLFMVGFVLISWLSIYYFKKLPYWAWPMSVLLLFFSVTHYHPQWFSWLTPFLLLAAVHSKKLWLPLGALLFCYLIVVLSFDPSLNVGFFGSHLNLFNLVNKYYSADRLVSFARSIFTATSIALVLAITFHETDA